MPAVDGRRKQVARLAMLLDGIDLNARRVARLNPRSDKGINTDLRVWSKLSVVAPPIDHDCSLKDFVTELADRLAKLEHESA
jgi:hypothetical protein